MTIETRILKFGSVEVTFVKHPEYSWVTPAKLLGQGLGYSAEGQKLVDLVYRWSAKSGPWKKRVVQVTGDALGEFKSLFEVYFFANSALLLNVEGVHAVLDRSRKPEAKLAREAMFSAGEGFAPAPRRVRPSRANPRAKAPTPGTSSSTVNPSIQDTILMLSTLTKHDLLSKAQCDLAVAKLMALQFAQVERTLQPVMAPAEQKLLPAETLGTPLPAGAKPLYGPHPKYKNWLTATEIGARHGLNYRQAAGFISKYVESIVGGELPNNLVRTWIATHSAVPTDAEGYTALHSALVDGYATPGNPEKDHPFWTNYWGPLAVSAIDLLIIQKHPKSNGTTQTVSKGFQG